jgi:hypothetical protein
MWSTNPISLRRYLSNRGEEKKRGKINGTVCSNTVVIPFHEKKRIGQKRKKPYLMESFHEPNVDYNIN